MQVHGTDLKVALVLGVARLGEAGLEGWWRAHGLDQAGEYVLKGSFPRTWRPSALELDLISATRRHDEILTRPTAVHLFSEALGVRRLATAWLAEQKAPADSEAPLVAVLANWSRDGAREDLASWASGAPVRPAHGAGPAISLGTITARSLEEEAAVEQACTELTLAYLGLDSFTPPYFELAS